MLVSVCICTYKRDSLESTLKSLAEQKLPEPLTLEIIVMDNDPLGSGQLIVQKYYSSTNLHYFICSEPNLSVIRNESLKKASGEYIAFIDDDGCADNNWIAELMSSLETHRADAVIGKVVTEYPPSTPDWIVKGDLFGKSIHRVGSQISRGYTCNAILDSRWVKEKKFQFALDFGKSGGEDTDFFHRIWLSGGKIVFENNAIVTETVEAGRLNLDYLKSTNTSIGQIHWKYLWSRQIGTRFWKTGFFVVGQIIASSVFYLLTLPLGKSYYVKWYLLLIRNCEKLRIAIVGGIDQHKNVERYGQR